MTTAACLFDGFRGKIYLEDVCEEVREREKGFVSLSYDAGIVRSGLSTQSLVETELARNFEVRGRT